MASRMCWRRHRLPWLDAEKPFVVSPRLVRLIATAELGWTDEVCQQELARFAGRAMTSRPPSEGADGCFDVGGQVGAAVRSSEARWRA